MSFSTYLTEKVTGMAKDKVDEFFEKIKGHHRTNPIDWKM